MTPRPGPRDLRASDADRERVAALLAQAAADGRLTLSEHSERIERAYAARTLGDLAGLTADLAEPAAQPIRLDGRRVVTAVFRRERLDGHWVVPDGLAVSAIFGQVDLDLRDALLASQRLTLRVLLIGGTVRLFVPEGVAVQVTGAAAVPVKQINRDAPAPYPGMPVIEVRTAGLGGRVRVVRPRRTGLRRVLGGLSRRRS